MSDDLIRRTDAIKVITSNYYRLQGCGLTYEYMLLQMEEIPSADRPQEWIPCSERLPEEKEGVYLICTDYGYLCSCRWTNDVYGLGANKWSAWGWCRLDVPQYSTVVAWMDLKPWKGADGEDV